MTCDLSCFMAVSRFQQQQLTVHTNKSNMNIIYCKDTSNCSMVKNRVPERRPYRTLKVVIRSVDVLSGYTVL